MSETDTRTAEMKNRLRQCVLELLPDIVDLRHDLHAHPERGWDVYQTRERLLSWLAAHGVEAQPVSYLGRSELVFDLQLSGDPRAPLVGLRADMDALPVQERAETSREFRSVHEGMMHACGHDGHMAILAGTLAAAKRAVGDKGLFPEGFPVNIRAIFQPAEEEICGGAELAASGVCEGLDRIYALHGWPGLSAGRIVSKPGVFFAAAATYSICLHGTPAHGAAPEEGNNPIIPAALLITALQDLHEQYSQSCGAVITTCAVSGGQSTNAIPEETRILGTTRYLDRETGAAVERDIRRAHDFIVKDAGISSDFVYESRYHIPLVNNAAEVNRLERAVTDMLGPQCWAEADSHTMTAEDFAFYLDRVPGCMFRLGIGTDAAPLHSSSFSFSDEAVEYGVLAFLGLLLT